MSKVWKLLFLVHIHLTGTKDEHTILYCHQVIIITLNFVVSSLNSANDLRDVFSITIVSSPKLGEDTICVNESVSLTCRTDQQVGGDVHITWYWQTLGKNQSKQGRTIAVLASRDEVVYTCKATDNNKVTGEANVTVVANGE